MDKLINIGEAAERLGISPMTLRCWEQSGKLILERTQCNQRCYRLSQIEPATHLFKQDRKTLAYAGVSSQDQKDDLERQKQVLERYCAQQGWTFELIADLSSYYKKSLKRLLNDILAGNVGRLVITHKDRLLRFGGASVFHLRSQTSGSGDCE